MSLETPLYKITIDVKCTLTLCAWTLLSLFLTNATRAWNKCTAFSKLCKYSNKCCKSRTIFPPDGGLIYKVSHDSSTYCITLMSINHRRLFSHQMADSFTGVTLMSINHTSDSQQIYISKSWFLTIKILMISAIWWTKYVSCLLEFK